MEDNIEMDLGDKLIGIGCGLERLWIKLCQALVLAMSNFLSQLAGSL